MDGLGQGGAGGDAWAVELRWVSGVSHLAACSEQMLEGSGGVHVHGAHPSTRRMGEVVVEDHRAATRSSR